LKNKGDVPNGDTLSDKLGSVPLRNVPFLFLEIISRQP
jgi:hypothetical protein